MAEWYPQFCNTMDILPPLTGTDCAWTCIDMSSPWNFTAPLLGGCYYQAQVTEDETETQTGKAACPRPHSQEAMELGCKARSLLSKAGVISHHLTLSPIRDNWAGERHLLRPTVWRAWGIYGCVRPLSLREHEVCLEDANKDGSECNKDDTI